MNKKLIAVTSAALLAALPAWSTLPVVDYTAIAQAIQQTLKQVQQYSQQVQSYQLQLQQYANMVRNTVAPAAQIYQSATGAINSVMGVARVFQSGS